VNLEKKVVVENWMVGSMHSIQAKRYVMNGSGLKGIRV
jgi:hypothetical protein